jgi:histidinol-phosphate aminotransferase
MIEDLLNLVRPEIKTLKAYSSARREHAAQGIYLNANENPYQKTSQASVNRYPQPQPELLRERLAALYHINPSHILMTRGSDEGIDLWLRAFCSAGKDAIMICPPTYDMYALSAEIQNAGVISVPLLPDNFALDVKSMMAAWQPHCKLIFLCSPNNPTGNVYSLTDMVSVCEQLKNKAIVIVDEAYIEFANQPSMSQFLEQYPNLAILRTLSKAYGMAGARCGAILAHPQLIKILEKVISPYPLASPVIELILQELQADKLIQVQAQIKALKQARDEFIIFLKKLSYVEKVWNSDANFILLKVKDAHALIAHCAAHDIIIRDRSFMFHLNNSVRISMGLPEENAQLMKLMEAFSVE